MTFFGASLTDQEKIPQAEFNRPAGNYRIKKYHGSTQEQK